MEDVSNTDVKKVEASTPVKETRSKEESPTEAGAGPVPQSSQEVLLSSHTYNSPDDEHSICETNEDRRSGIASPSPSSPEDVCKTVDKHNGVQVDSSGISGDICLGSLMSADLLESELNSQSSGELLDNNELVARKKKRDLMKTDETEDPEEEFRKHFLKTFQNLPRISQISLDDNPINPTTESKQNAEIDTEMPNTSNEDAGSLKNEGVITGKAILRTNLSTSDADNIEQPDNNITENTEITLLQNSYIQEKENADEIPSSSNKNI
ncbi:uncharacterized protein LOC27208248 [Drosophila simulans]|uniref:Uncharacterized protein n=1 Tax=Drosophila simulans TaxID=7240 RepID=A0A0J9TDW7_DROSI|nr:uncharacterized protein LOC27208248 [Drosophila simulans]KMY87670.1 uncharacterized protein Dsimw501_GD28400 [Drosophila simulans]